MMDRTSRASAIHVETRSDGAVFRVEFDAETAGGPLELQRRYQKALNEVDAFCQSYFTDEDADRHIVGVEQFDDWPCDEFRNTPFRYSGLGNGCSEFVIIIADRWLAASFKRAFAGPNTDPA